MERQKVVDVTIRSGSGSATTVIVLEDATVLSATLGPSWTDPSESVTDRMESQTRCQQINKAGAGGASHRPSVARRY